LTYCENFCKCHNVLHPAQQLKKIKLKSVPLYFEAKQNKTKLSLSWADSGSHL
jgi:hypothetical protein